MNTSIKVIDRHNGNAILKIVRPTGKTIYQTMPEADVGKNAANSVQHTTLSDARKHIGQPAPKVEPVVSGRKYSLQNQKGYRADSAKSGKKGG